MIATPTIPDNNSTKPHWWRVIGMRHCALVRARTQKEAIRKAIDEGPVAAWEEPTAKELGTYLPDVIPFC